MNMWYEQCRRACDKQMNCVETLERSDTDATLSDSFQLQTQFGTIFSNAQYFLRPVTVTQVPICRHQWVPEIFLGVLLANGSLSFPRRRRVMCDGFHSGRLLSLAACTGLSVLSSVPRHSLFASFLPPAAHSPFRYSVRAADVLNYV